MNRRQALGCLSAAFAPALPATAVRAVGAPLQVFAAAGDASSTALYAQERGFFTKAGLDVHVEVLANGGVTVPAVVGGAAQVGGTSVPTLALAYERGVPLAAIFPAAIYSNRAPTSELLVAKDSPLRTARDLSAKTVAVNGLNTISHIATMAWIDKNGGESKSVKYIELIYSAMIPALAQGHIDAALFIEPDLTLAKSVGRVLAPVYDAIGPHFYLGVYVATTSWLSENKDSAKRFVDAMGNAASWANSHHRESLEILARSLKVAPATLRGMTRATFAERLDPAEMQPVIDVSVRYGTLKTSVAASQIIWP